MAGDDSQPDRMDSDHACRFFSGSSSTIRIKCAGRVASLHYPTMDFGWFGEDLPELLLVYVIIWAVAQIAREWHTGSIELLGQIPLTRCQIVRRKGLCGSAEIALVSLVPSTILWIAGVAGDINCRLERSWV